VLLAPAPPAFSGVCAIDTCLPAFENRAPDGHHQLIEDPPGRLAVVLIDGATPDTPSAAVVAMDADFAVRSESVLRLWRVLNGCPGRRAPDRLTPQRRQRLALTLRALDARLGNEVYRVIAQGLFGAARAPEGGAWTTDDLHDRTRRMVRSGFELMQGGYLDLLRSPPARLAERAGSRGWRKTAP
jgi:hypothetical protein